MNVTRGWMLATALLALAGCTTVARDSPDACKFEKLGEAPLTGALLQPVVQIEIDGKPLNMLLDTGAGTTVVTQASFERVGLEQNRLLAGWASGAGGAKGVYTPIFIKVGSLKVAGVEANFPRLSPIAGPFALASRSSTAIDGMLGNDILGRYDIDIDLPHHKIALYRPRNCSDGGPPWTSVGALVQRPRQAPPDSRPLADVDDVGCLNGDHRPFMMVGVDGKQFLTLIDTGATGVVIDRKVAVRLGITETMLEQDKRGLLNGAAPDKVTAVQHKFTSLRFLDQTLPSPDLLVSDVGGAPELVFGMPLLQFRRMWIPVHGSRVYFGPVTKPDPL